jgi:hypothetical protein
MSFGEHLRKLREAGGLSRAELARKAAVPAGTFGGLVMALLLVGLFVGVLLIVRFVLIALHTAM